MNIAETHELLSHPLYPKIMDIIARFKREHLLIHGSGYCWAMSDIIHRMLNDVNIPNHMTEVDLTILDVEPPTKIHIIGLKNNNVGGVDQITTHVVVIVEHEQPILIDCSINHLLPDGFQYVVGLTNGSDKTILEVTKGSLSIVYRERLSESRIPALYQQGILKRIEMDQLMDKSLTTIRKQTQIIVATIFVLFVSLAYNFWNTYRMDRILETNRDRLQTQSRRIDSLDNRFTALTERMNTHTNRFNNISERLNDQSNRIDKVEEKTRR